MKTVFVVWYWHVGCPLRGEKKPWNSKHFGSESRASTWLSHNFWFIFLAEGAYCDIDADADIPEAPPSGSRLLIGDRDSNNYHKGGRFPVVPKLANPEHPHKSQRVNEAWRLS